MRVALKIIDCSIAPEEVYYFTIPGFPALPAKGDAIDVYEIVKELCTADMQAHIEAHSWKVDQVAWCKDETDIYPEIICKCVISAPE